ncbi:hypothetical protein VDGD_20079 [Verticillium dahliae]|nr:hypothetical protein VDGD_20079 [Verticillium dahliae]
MNLVRLHLIPDHGKEDLGLLVRPAAQPREQGERVGLERILDKLHTESTANLPEMGVLGPRAERHAPLDDADVLEAGVLEQLGQCGGDVEAEGLCETAKLGEPLVRLGRLGEGAVVAEEVGAALGDLDLAPRDEVMAALAEKGGPVLDGAPEGAGVDKVKVVAGPGPRKGGIIDLEADVGRHPGGLDGGEVGADDLGGGELVAGVYGPDARAGAQVEDAPGVLEMGDAQLAVEGEGEDVVGEVEAVLLLVVIGKEVLAGAVAVVAAAILILEIEHGGGDTGCVGDVRGIVGACVVLCAQHRVFVVHLNGLQMVIRGVGAAGDGGRRGRGRGTGVGRRRSW